MEAKELTKLAVKALEDKKGEDIRVIDIHGVSVLADYFVIADGSNASQVKAMADNVEEELGKAGHECRQIEGYQTARMDPDGLRRSDRTHFLPAMTDCFMIWSASGEMEK